MSDDAPLSTGDPYRDLILATPDALLVLNSEGEVVFANPSAERLWSRSPLTGETLNLPLTIPTQEHMLTAPDGSTIVLQIHLTAIQWQGQGAMMVSARDVTPYHAMQNQLEAEKYRYERMLDAVAHLSVGIVLADPHQPGTPLTYVSPGFTALTGYSAQEAIGRNCRFLQGVDTDPETSRAIGYAIRNEQTFRGEILNYHKDGTPFWNALLLAPIHDDYGNLIHYVGLQSDITERKKIEESLYRLNDELERRVEARTAELRQIVNTLPDYIYVVECQSQRMLLGNNAYARLFGKESCENDIEGKSIDELFPPDLVERFRKQNDYVCQTGNDFHEVEDFVNQGVNLVMDTHKVPLRNADGQVYAILGASRNITPMIDIQKARDEQTTRMRALVNHYPSGALFIFDHDLRYLLAGGTILKELGWAGNKYEGLTLYEVFSQMPIQQITYFEALYRTALSGETAEYETEYKGRVYLGNARPITDDNGEILAGMLLVQDITARKKAETELQEALSRERELNELRNRFVSMMSHDLRTPLSVIYSSTNMLRNYSDRFTEEQRLARLAVIQSEVRNLNEMLDQVLAIGKGQLDAFHYEPIPMHVADFCMHIVEEIHQAIETPHYIRLHAAKDMNTVYADPTLLKPALSNLLMNAIKYSPERYHIDFSVHLDGEHLIFQVKDYGIGIAPDDQVELFRMFKRGKNVEGIHGTGLGLVIVKQAIEAHQGKVELESALDKGTTVTVSVPVAQIRA